MTPRRLRKPRQAGDHPRIEPGQNRRKHRRGLGTVALAATIALGTAMVAAPSPAAAGPEPGPEPGQMVPAEMPAAAETIALEGVDGGSHVVTLITGDKVSLTGSDGRFTLDTEPSTRPDGHQPSLFVQTGPDAVYVLPDDAMPAIYAGRLDRELFNVKYLAENGYTDDKTDQVPVIVEYPDGRSVDSVRSAADAIPGSVPTHTLESINGAALTVAKAYSGTFWAAVRTAVPADDGAGDGVGMASVPNPLRAGIEKVWLDGKVQANLDESVPMIGAPDAWAGGHDGAGVQVAVLDTGVDANHPDLNGKVVASQSFVPGAPVQDGHGHGTHVAATIAGSGAGAGGTFKGTAPGAELIVGKVLDDSGSGLDSWIIEAMEWAAASGAKVVSMSLGGVATDGTDPMSQAVNDLSATTGTLFVIAAGNSGAADDVRAPGTADAALTVAAVDKSDALADFSSRGPRFGDSALKPDIAAPGVDITAARASGTSMGSPVDDLYTAASGTSMATPHVAGAVAILAQQHPDWTGPMLKAALMSTAKDDGYSVYEQGAGRVDLTTAHSQPVFALTVAVDFASISEEDQTLQRDLSYTNPTDQPVTLTLTPALRTTNGTVVDGKLSTDAAVTVPAAGTATTTVTLDPAGLEFGKYTGSVTARADGIRLTTPVGAVREAPTVQLTIRTIDRDGNLRTPSRQGIIDVSGSRPVTSPPVVVDEGIVTTRVPVGTLNVAQMLPWVDDDDRRNVAWLFNPEVTLTEDTEITLDARQASQVRFTTPKPAEPLNNSYTFVFQRTVADGATFGSTVLNNRPVGAWERLWVLPTKPVTTGKFRVYTQWTLGQSEVAMSVSGAKPVTLHPITPMHGVNARGPEQDSHHDWVPFTGTQDLEVVDVGKGRPEDIAGLDLAGKLVLLEADFQEGLTGPVCGADIDRIGAIRDAGAAGLVTFPTEGTGCTVPLRLYQTPFTGPSRPIGIPNVSLSTREALELRAQVARKPVTVRVVGTPETPYTYVLKQYEDGHVPTSMHYTFGARQLARIDLDVHASQATRFTDFRLVWRQDDALNLATAVSGWAATAFAGPHTRTEWVSIDPTVIQQHGMSAVDLDERTYLETRWRTELFDRPVRAEQDWYTTGTTPGAGTVSPQVHAPVDPEAPPLTAQGIGVTCSICVQDNVLWASFALAGSSNGNRFVADGFWRRGTFLIPEYDVHLYRDGTEVPRTAFPTLDQVPAFILPEGSGTYRLTAQNAAHDVEWTFTAPPSEEHVQPGFSCTSWFLQGAAEQCRPTPAVFVDYDLGESLAMDNTVAAGGRHRFTVDAYHSPSAATMPEIAGLRLWASIDDGATWEPAQVRRNRDGSYTADTTYPAFHDTTGAVSLKVEAWDSDGNSVKMTSNRLFWLRDGR